jgi:hypothetical protein
MPERYIEAAGQAFPAIHQRQLLAGLKVRIFSAARVAHLWMSCIDLGSGVIFDACHEDYG